VGAQPRSPAVAQLLVSRAPTTHHRPLLTRAYWPRSLADARQRRRAAAAARRAARRDPVQPGRAPGGVAAVPEAASQPTWRAACSDQKEEAPLGFLHGRGSKTIPPGLKTIRLDSERGRMMKSPLWWEMAAAQRMPVHGFRARYSVRVVANRRVRQRIRVAAWECRSIVSFVTSPSRLSQKRT
jgi:hypothetical protein